jgi:hypothetical protein
MDLRVVRGSGKSRGGVSWGGWREGPRLPGDSGPVMGPDFSGALVARAREAGARYRCDTLRGSWRGWTGAARGWGCEVVDTARLPSLNVNFGAPLPARGRGRLRVDLATPSPPTRSGRSLFFGLCLAGSPGFLLILPRRNSHSLFRLWAAHLYRLCLLLTLALLALSSSNTLCTQHFRPLFIRSSPLSAISRIPGNGIAARQYGSRSFCFFFCFAFLFCFFFFLLMPK